MIFSCSATQASATCSRLEVHHVFLFSTLSVACHHHVFVFTVQRLLLAFGEEETNEVQQGPKSQGVAHARRPSAASSMPISRLPVLTLLTTETRPIRLSEDMSDIDITSGICTTILTRSVGGKSLHTTQVRTGNFWRRHLCARASLPARRRTCRTSIKAFERQDKHSSKTLSNWSET